jgi:hypothetical protein
MHARCPKNKEWFAHTIEIIRANHSTKILVEISQ